MDRKQQVLLKLKPKVKAFGFNKKEVMGIAARIADNLTSTDDASDEDVNAEIEAAIDAVLPYLQVSQSFANRVIEEKPQKRMAMTKPMTAMIHHRTLQTIVRRVQNKNRSSAEIKSNR